MESQMSHHIFERRSLFKSKAPAVKWFKEWVPQDVVATGGKCQLLKWVTEDMKVMNERSKEPDAPEPEPEPTTEVLFLCSYEGCGKTFIDVGALKKHSHIHGERQYVCHYEGCGKKFLDSSKLKRHFLIHTGERDFVCPHEGCGKAFSLDFNLRSHMKTHSQENYHLCPYMDCGKRYAHEYKLKNHISIHHEKNMLEVTLPPPPPPLPLLEKPLKNTKPSPSTAAAAGDRPYSCPLEGCDKTYIHVYKLNLHLRKGHKIDLSDDNAKMEGKKKRQTTSKPSKPSLKAPTSKISRGKASSPSITTNDTSVNAPVAWPIKEEMFGEEDSEETEEDEDNCKDRWRSAENNDDDDYGATATAVSSDDDDDDGGHDDGGGGDDDGDEEDTEFED